MKVQKWKLKTINIELEKLVTSIELFFPKYNIAINESRGFFKIALPEIRYSYATLLNEFDIENKNLYHWLQASRLYVKKKNEFLKMLMEK